MFRGSATVVIVVVAHDDDGNVSLQTNADRRLNNSRTRLSRKRLAQFKALPDSLVVTVVSRKR